MKPESFNMILSKVDGSTIDLDSVMIIEDPSKIDPSTFRSLEINLDLTKLEFNTIKIIKYYKNYNIFWYGILGEEEYSFQKLLNISYYLYIQLFMKLRIIREEKSSLVVKSYILE